MMAPPGVALVKTIGEVFKGRDAKIILAPTFQNFKSWFAETSGLPEDRLACIVVPIAIHETKAKLKTHGYVDMEQFEKPTMPTQDSILTSHSKLRMNPRLLVLSTCTILILVELGTALLRLSRRWLLAYDLFSCSLYRWIYSAGPR
ncbi:hypothetical protein N7493_004050 [Penicillium malachiteum]|uniref:Uncharacterized protein n=1 Tax=Penicillium malachiteum TaxID=1324776 RepID=A0AAD6HR61_9EURO|nr:hypothetical protein N7493_004050 [Penicillium malachiteum]